MCTLITLLVSAVNWHLFMDKYFLLLTLLASRLNRQRLSLLLNLNL